MRITTLALIGGLGFAALPLAAGAAPLAAEPPMPISSNIINVAGGCGPGYHPESWRDRYGYWHRRCVPNYRGGYGPPPHRGPWPEPRWGWGWRGY
jgi:hypothetical protein